MFGCSLTIVYLLGLGLRGCVPAWIESAPSAGCYCSTQRRRPAPPRPSNSRRARVATRRRPFLARLRRPRLSPSRVGHEEVRYDLDSAETKTVRDVPGPSERRFALDDPDPLALLGHVDRFEQRHRAGADDHGVVDHRADRLVAVLVIVEVSEALEGITLRIGAGRVYVSLPGVLGHTEPRVRVVARAATSRSRSESSCSETRWPAPCSARSRAV